MNRIEAAKDLLKRIEAVDHTDDAALDEIDARWWCCTSNRKYNGKLKTIEDSVAHNGAYVPRRIIFYSDGLRCTQFNFYTRSRDALKSARPDGWKIQITQNRDGWYVKLTREIFIMTPCGRNRLSTETLAELHAIIQAWIHTWKNEC